MSALVLGVFFLGGLVLAGVAPLPKFALLSVLVTALFFAYDAASTGQIGRALGQAAVAFVCVQVGYVGGAAITTILRRPGVGKYQSKSTIQSKADSPLAVRDRKAQR